MTFRNWPQTHETPLDEWRFVLPLVTGLPAIVAGGCFHRLVYRLPRLVAASCGGCSCRVSAVFAGSPEFSSSRYITGTLVIAISMPFARVFAFNHLRICAKSNRFDSGKPAVPRFKKP